MRSVVESCNGRLFFFADLDVQTWIGRVLSAYCGFVVLFRQFWSWLVFFVVVFRSLCLV